jgi:drug/metabolite transporter (DMT)-like permease
VQTGINTGLLLAFGSMFFMGLSNFIYKKSTDAIGATNTTFYYYLFSFIIATIVWSLFREKADFPRTMLIWPFCIAVSLFSSVWMFNLSIREIDLSLAVTLRGLSFVVTLIIAIVVLKENPSPTGIAGIVLAICAAFLISIK